jgi:hypothetical protein
MVKDTPLSKAAVTPRLVCRALGGFVFLFRSLIKISFLVFEHRQVENNLETLHDSSSFRYMARLLGQMLTLKMSFSDFFVEHKSPKKCVFGLSLCLP